MILKIFGAVLIIAGCGGVGFRIASNHRQEEKNLRQLIGILNYMECELQYRLTPFPELCRKAAVDFSGLLGKVFFELGVEIETQKAPDLDTCMQTAVSKSAKLTPKVREELLLLGRSVCRFDIDGQIKGFEAVRQDSRRLLEGLTDNRDTRLRSYQTLGLCAGAALAILFI